MNCHGNDTAQMDVTIIYIVMVACLAESVCGFVRHSSSSFSVFDPPEHEKFYSLQVTEYRMQLASSLKSLACSSKTHVSKHHHHTALRPSCGRIYRQPSPVSVSRVHRCTTAHYFFDSLVQPLFICIHLPALECYQTVSKKLLWSGDASRR